MLIDGVITTGGSITASINAIRSEGGEVEDTVVWVDRLEGARKNLRKIGVSVHSLTDILEVNPSSGIVTDAQPCGGGPPI